MIKFFCDRCGKEIINNRRRFEDPMQVHYAFSKTNQNWDKLLCQTCGNELVEWMKGEKETGT